MPKKQSDGRYRAKITIGHTADGKPITKYVSGITKRELEEAKAAARKHYIDGAERRDDMLFAEYAEAWYHAKKEMNLSQSSRVGYINSLNNHIIPAFGARMLRSIQPLEIQAWLNGYKGKSKTAITMQMSIVKNVFASAYSEGIIQRNPCTALVRPKAEPPEEKRALTDEERHRVEKTIVSHKHGDYLAVLYYLGLRRGEALGLQWGDFDWRNKTVSVQRDIDYSNGNIGIVGPLKTKAAYRDVPIEDDLEVILRSKRGLPGVFLFKTKNNNPLPYATAMRWWVELMIDAGLAKQAHKKDENVEEKKRKDLRFEWECLISPHYLRHNYATRLYKAGVDPIVAMKILGHSDYSTTAKIYTHLDNTHISSALDKLKAAKEKKKVAEKLPDG